MSDSGSVIRLRELVGHDTPWPLISVLRRLADAADHLLKAHDCDEQGWEAVGIARDAARRYADALAAALALAVVPSVMPVDGGPSIPWAVIEPHELQAQKNHAQSLQRLAERGGLCCSEAVAILEDRSWMLCDERAARERLIKILDAAAPPVVAPVAAPVQCDCDGPSKCAEHDAVKQLSAALPLTEGRAGLEKLLDKCHEFVANVEIDAEWWESQRRALCDELDATPRPQGESDAKVD